MNPEAFIRANAALLAPPLVPEIKLYLATEVVPLWRATEDELAKIGVPPPYWAFAWAGGQALARYILDKNALHRFGGTEAKDLLGRRFDHAGTHSHTLFRDRQNLRW